MAYEGTTDRDDGLDFLNKEGLRRLAEAADRL
jgi:hypothetical protein